ncbi:MAG TPA: hypothetical protein VNW47_03705 [Terriglobales bacterium]|jgi:hypothetical protein|nr:hypothetical protein [Terriglobales bacterium]
MNEYVSQYYRCPERYLKLSAKEVRAGLEGYFRFGDNIVCYGPYNGTKASYSPAGSLSDANCDTVAADGEVSVPFDVERVVDNLRFERYASAGAAAQVLESPLNRLYYLVRPLLPVAVRKHLQRIRLSGWDKISFPQWPVDCTVDNLLERLLLLSLRANRLECIPFIWFWPNGASSSAIMTHDVETAAGRDFCASLMDIDDRFGIKAAFQVVPEERYEVTPEYLESITTRGFEVAVQDLNHDGRLYRNRQQFLTRAAKINAYGRRWGASGFRAAILYRREEWFDSLDFSYEMSVPNVAHLDPQRGGCCTVMPYFIGKLLELPVTTTQDYSLFHILRDHSIGLWEQQIDLIMEKHGLISMIVHPDYIITRRERETYEVLLKHLVRIRDEKGVWITTPNEVNRWWRQRAEMDLVKSGDGWRIEGEGKERARIAYAREERGQLTFSFVSETVSC